MKNREKYKEFLDDCLVNHLGFGVDKNINEPRLCEVVGCNDCKLYCNHGSCGEYRRKWLDQEECDKWEGYSHLKRGDVVFVKMGTLWLPVIFVCFECNKLVYTSCADDDGEFPCHVNNESDPRKIRKDIRRVELRYEE